VSLPDLTGLLAALVGARVEFVVVGGVALAALEYVRATEDVDIVPQTSAENLDALVNLLISLHAHLALSPNTPVGPDQRRAVHQGRNLSVTTDLGDLDILVRMPGVPSFETLAEDASRVEVAGVEVSVCSRAHLIAMKRARSSAIDLADLERLAPADD
jgi:hypothetical protein